MDHYNKVKLLGRGNFGRVILVQRKSDNKELAMKLIMLGQEIQSPNPNFEANRLKSLEHPNIIKCYETFIEEDNLVLIMEYCDKGDLLQKVKEHQKSKTYIPEEEILEWFTQLCLAIRYLHDQKIIHRDIKVQNTFLTSSGIIKLGDFGISKQLDQTDEMAMTQTGTPYYLTPEMISKSCSSLKSDIWMLGCLLHELCSLQKPFQGDTIPAVLNKILKEDYAEIPSMYSPLLHKLVEILLEKDEAKRPSIQQILEIPELQEQVRIIYQIYPEIQKLNKKYPKIFQPYPGPSKIDLSDSLPRFKKNFSDSLVSYELSRSRKSSEDFMLSKEEHKTSNIPTLDESDPYHPSEKPSEESRPSTLSLISPKDKPPRDHNSLVKIKPNNIRQIIENRKPTLSPSNIFDRPPSFNNTPSSGKQINSPLTNTGSQQFSPIIRPVPVRDTLEEHDTSSSESRETKPQDMGVRNKNFPKKNHDHLFIDIPSGPKHETTEHPNSKGEMNKASNRKSPIESTDPNSIPTTKTVQKKFAFSDQVFDHRSPASPNRSFWVSQFVKEKLGEEKYQKVKDLLESSPNPMQVLNDQVLKIVGEENRDCLVMLSFLISHSSSSVTPTGETTKDTNKIFKNFDKNFKSPLSSQRLMKHTFPVNDLIDSGQKSTPLNLRSGTKTPKTLLENNSKVES